MTSEHLLSLLRHQRERGPLPESRLGLSAWLSALSQRVPAVSMEVPLQAISPLRALGLVVDQRDARAFVSFPADGDALDRVWSLLGLPALSQGGAEALLAALEHQEDPQREPPALSLPLRIQPAKASSLGWSSELFSLTVLISNVTMRKHDRALLPTDGRPVVAVCAEYDRPLTSLDPPGIADYALQRARDQGVPMLRLKSGGFFTSPLCLEETSQRARAPQGRPAAMARAGKFLAELNEAWERRVGPLLEVAWPVYRPAGKGPLLDAVVGRPLPEIELA